MGWLYIFSNFEAITQLPCFERKAMFCQPNNKKNEKLLSERAFFTLSSVFVNDLSKIINNKNNFKSHCTVIVILCGFDSLFECFVFDKGHEITSAVLWGFQTKLEAVKFRNFISQYPQLLTLFTSMLFRLLLVVEKKKLPLLDVFKLKRFLLLVFVCF